MVLEHGFLKEFLGVIFDWRDREFIIFVYAILLKILAILIRCLEDFECL